MLEFEPGVTVVVGPNGSGKSNVVDAVAWVLGAQGPRTVALGEMEDVIFMGTANRPALGRAEVSLTIDNTSGKLSADLAEVTITRTLFRSGDSEYSINGVPCRLLDIQELLSDTGVGRQQHVIISQETLDAFQARPEDRRSVIEEAAGVLEVPPAPRAVGAPATTEENLERLFDLVREAQAPDPTPGAPGGRGASRTGLADELRAVRLYVAGSELRRSTAGTPTASATRRSSGPGRPADRGAGRPGRRLGADGRRAVRRAGSRPDRRVGSHRGMVERARGLSGVCERQRSLARALDAAADADVVSTLEAEGARLAPEELQAAVQEATDLAPEQDGDC